MVENLLHSEITERILKCYFSVNRLIPSGLPADFYGNALTIEFERNGLKAVRNHPVEVKFRGEGIGCLVADFLVEGKVLVKVIGKDSVDKEAEDSTRLLLRFSEFEVGMILNSSGDFDFKRLILSNEFKKNVE